MVVVAVRGEVVLVTVIVWNRQLTPEQVVGSPFHKRRLDAKFEGRLTENRWVNRVEIF